MEERDGERRRVCFGWPLSSVLSPLLRRGERKDNPRRKFLAVRRLIRMAKNDAERVLLCDLCENLGVLCV
jgi:hypothetical protein